MQHHLYSRFYAIIAFLFFTACLPACAQVPDESTNRYNVLFIAVDDLRPELGCYGVGYVDTPNIDRLADSGVTFRQHFVSVPTCGASRYALLTGRDPSSSGVRRGNGALYQGPTALSAEQLPGAQTLPELFRRSGYRTVLIGKLSHTADGRVFAYNGTGDGRDELPHAWDDYATPYGAWQRGWGIFFAYADGRSREDGRGHSDLFEFAVDNDTDLPDGQLAERAIEKLKELKNRDEPFFMGLGLFKPHLPFVAPRQDWDAVAGWDVPPPAVPGGIGSRYSNKNSGEFYRYTMPWDKSRPLALDDAMRAKRGYLACVRYTDRQVGKVLDALEQEGLADSTIVVLWGDHGWFLGDGAQWGKHSPLETALHSPLIIRAPGVARPGVKTDALAATTDLYPTLIDLCRPAFTRTTHPLDGVSQVPVLTGEAEQVREQAVSYWGDAVSVRTMTHRLIGKQQGDAIKDIELYDLRDPEGAWIDVAEAFPGDLHDAFLEQLRDERDR